MLRRVSTCRFCLWSCRYVLQLYMKVIILIDLFYLAGIKMVRHYDAGESRYGCYLIFLTLIIEAAAITINVFGYITFANK